MMRLSIVGTRNPCVTRSFSTACSQAAGSNAGRITRRRPENTELAIVGAAPMPYEVVRRAVDVFPTVGLMNAYGQTESTGSMTYLGPEDHKLDGTPEQNAKK